MTAIEELNDFRQYTLTILGIDQNDCYTNKGTVTINEEELQPLLQEKELSFPKGIIGQRVKVISHEKLRQEHRIFLKALPHFVERRDKLTVDDFQRRRHFQHLVRQLSRLLAQAFHNGAVQRNAFGRPAACALLRGAGDCLRERLCPAPERHGGRCGRNAHACFD